MSGGTATGVFGATQSSSPSPSTTTFGATSSPAFGSSVHALELLQLLLLVVRHHHLVDLLCSDNSLVLEEAHNQVTEAEL